MNYSERQVAQDHMHGPRTWPLRFALACARLFARLPYRWQIVAGHALGWTLFALSRERRHVARTNIALCFRELTSAEQRALVHSHFVSLGMAAVETAMAWWAPRERLRALARIEGLANLECALARGKGVILMAAHMTTLEIGGIMLAGEIPLSATYRKHKNPLFNAVMTEARQSRLQDVIPHGSTRAMLRLLKANKVVWYSPDQNYAGKHSVFVPFFGIPASTMTATAHLARLSGAAVVPMMVERLAGVAGYRISLEPALADFPSDDVGRDTARINACIEMNVRRAPAQYLWAHRRFKTRPPGEPPAY